MDRAVFRRIARLHPFSMNGVARVFNSAFQAVQYSITTVPEFESKESKHNHGGNWFTLPPFTKIVDGAALGRELVAGRSSKHEAKATAETSALKWVLKCCPELPRSLVQKLFRLRQVRRKSATMENTEASSGNPLKRVGGKDLLSVGDQIFLPPSVQEELPSRRQEPLEKQGTDCTEEEVNFIRGLQLYEDSAVVVFNKPPGMPVQGGIGVKRSFDQLAAKCLSDDNLEPPRLVHRLDRDTSGILVMGKTQMSATILHSIFREKTSGASNYYSSKDKEPKKRILQRKYWALVIGSPKHKEGLIRASLAKVVMDKGKSERITVINSDQNGLSQHAITEYRVIKPSIQGYTWLELRPLTGRKHQLRVHCAEVLGSPIVGDYKYGWQAHRKWQPLPCSSIVKDSDELHMEKKKVPFGLDFQTGSVFEKHPRLHLHCKEMVLPDVCQALQTLQLSPDHDVSDVRSLELVAPLPPYMQTSWDLISY